MEKLTRAQKFFKRHVAHFLQRQEREADVKTIDLLHAYTEYLKSNYYYHNFAHQEVIQILTKEYHDKINVTSFVQGLQAMAANVEPTIILLQKEVESLKQRLSDQKSKNTNLKDGMLYRIQQLEKEVAAKPQVMYIAHKAFQAGVNSTQLVQRQPLNPELQPYTTIQKTMNFRTWANKVWKYGKVKGQQPKIQYKAHPLDLPPLDLEPNYD